MASEAPPVDLDTDDAFYALHHFIFQGDSMKRGTSLSNPCRDIDNYLDFLENIPELQSTPEPDTRANRVRLLLDAFVKICQPHSGEVLALSLALRPSAGSTDSTLATVGKPEKLILNIAGNGPPPTELTEYLGGIWNRLKQISVLEKEARTKGGHPDASEPNTGDSPPAVGSDETAQSQLIGQLYEDIHLFCFRKSRSRLVGFVGPWNTFFPFFLSISQTTCIGGSGKVHDLFSTVCCALNLIINGLLECTPVFVKAHSDLWHAYWQLVKLGKEDDWYDELEFLDEFFDECE
ncbi:hypothetical protein K440DRAFT_27043 [Wilcoxina mikolae CBS 423.85]|nr:hypothetical protein K440DRAFT_27043 [Wilcoxina mikolae CBS 423.85]